MIIKRITTTLTLIALTFGISCTTQLNAMSSRAITNVIELATAPIITKIVNVYILKNTTLSTTSALTYGISAVAAGHIIEMVYKHLIEHKILDKKNTKKTLRDTLGSSKIFGTDIDHQRLLREVITTILLSLGLYLGT